MPGKKGFCRKKTDFGRLKDLERQSGQTYNQHMGRQTGSSSSGGGGRLTRTKEDLAKDMRVGSRREREKSTGQEHHFSKKIFLSLVPCKEKRKRERERETRREREKPFSLSKCKRCQQKDIFILFAAATAGFFEFMRNKIVSQNERTSCGCHFLSWRPPACCRQCFTRFQQR